MILKSHTISEMNPTRNLWLNSFDVGQKLSSQIGIRLTGVALVVPMVTSLDVISLRMNCLRPTEGPRVTRILGLGKNHVTCYDRDCGNVLWSPTNATSPICTYISQKLW